MSGLLRLPRLGETMEEGRVVGWLVDVGAAFKRGDALVEVETDKTVVEVPALGPGRVLEHLVGEGETVGLGTPLARLEIEGADWTDDGSTSGTGEAPAGSADQTPQAEGRTDRTDASSAGAERHASEPANGFATPGSSDTTTRLRATPLARRIARQRNVDLATVTGTGRRGRIERGDVERAADGAGDIAPSAAAPKGALYMRDSGPAAGTEQATFVLLHGFAGDADTWAVLAAQLERAGARVLAPDLPGHGRTSLPADTPEALSTGLAHAVAERVGGAPVHVVAHSLGAVPALDLAQARAERGGTASLTLIAPVGLGLGIDHAFVSGLAHAQQPGEVAHLLARMVEMPLPLSEGAIAEIAATLATGRLTRLADALLGPTGQAVSLRAPLAALAERLAVRIVLGHRDRIVPWQESLGVSPRIATHHLPRAGHVPHWEEPAAVRDLLLAQAGVAVRAGA